MTVTKAEKIEKAKAWWIRNFKFAEENWTAYLELGTILGEDEREEPPLETKANASHMHDPIQWQDPRPVAYTPTLALDPMPYVSNYGTEAEERFSWSDPGKVYGIFKPRPGHEQSFAVYERKLVLPKDRLRRPF